MNTAGHRTAWSAHRAPAIGTGGMVGAKTPQAAEAGIAMLAKGGNAIDAAIATAFAVGVTEPFMSGLGGGGYMTVWLAREQRSLIIDYPMISAAAATEDMFPLADAGSSGDAFLFGWPATINNANVTGYSSIAVPGTVAGLALALERYGTLSLADVMEPAIALAEEGFPVTWHTTLVSTLYLPLLRQFPATVEALLGPDGFPFATFEQHKPAIHRQPALATTLRAIAKGGPREFYEGETGRTITEHLSRNGSRIIADDFTGYQAVEREPITIEYHGAEVHTVGGGTGGTSLGEALTMLDVLPAGNPACRDAGELHMMAQVFRQAFADRYAYLADPDHTDIPQAGLLDPAYARERIATFDPRQATPPRAGNRERLGVTHQMPPSVAEYVQTRSGSTTHLGVIDAEGNAVSLTQTLLGLYGSSVVIPGTGVLMNNGMMWFDPEPGRPNSVGGHKKPLSNMAPAIVTRDGQVLGSVGSSGGRKIQNCNAQVIMNIVDGDMGAQEAIVTPQIDASTVELIASVRIPGAVREALGQMGHDVATRDESMMTLDFASPVAIRRQEDGTLDGGADPYYFPATVIAVDGD